MVINIEDVVKLGLFINEYLDLKYLYCLKKSTEPEFTDNYQEPDIIHYENKGYIKLDENSESEFQNKYELRDKIRNLFEGERDLFLTFLSTFPIKTPSGRYLGTQNENTIKGKNLRKKWNKLFKDDVLSAQKAIDVLEAEMEWRRKTGKFEFMHNAETWLHQGDFQNYEYLLNDKKSIKTKIRGDYE